MLPVKIKIVNLGNVEREFKCTVEYYETRLSRLAHMRFSRKISPSAILLDESGVELNSGDFYGLILEFAKNGKEIEFAVGPPEGFPHEVKRNHRKISLSRLSLRHEIAYLILLEQMYRALLKMRGTAYEK